MDEKMSTNDGGCIDLDWYFHCNEKFGIKEMEAIGCDQCNHL